MAGIVIKAAPPANVPKNEAVNPMKIKRKN